MTPLTLENLTNRLELGELLWAGRETMFEPQDLPGRYGRVIQALDHVLEAISAESVVAGGWAVWRHGVFARMTLDVDIVLAKDAVEKFLRVAAVSGFEILPQQPGRWPKLRHKETDIQVDILPEGERPGTPGKLAPTTIPHPTYIGATATKLRYIPLPRLIELKLAAGRVRDDFDVVELLRANPEKAGEIRNHLAEVHPTYVARFDELVERAQEQQDQ
jgi:hypothetical protein